MVTAIDVKNPIEVRKAALRVLNEHLGADVTRAFMGYEDAGDYTAEKYERPELSFDEITEKIKKASAEIRARRGVA